MKLEDIARYSIEIIKENGENGISTSELAGKLGVPKRRVYDVKAIMKAAGLINTTRDKHGTRMYWSHRDQAAGKEVSRIRSNRIKISTTGFITNVSNRGTEVIIESNSPSMLIEKL